MKAFRVTDKQTGRLRPVTPGDIVILLRSPKNKAPTYIAELERIGVTASAEQRGGLLETAEVRSEGVAAQRHCKSEAGR